jgi:hypothetical protein
MPGGLAADRVGVPPTEHPARPRRVLTGHIVPPAVILGRLVQSAVSMGIAPVAKHHVSACTFSGWASPATS